MKKLLLLFALLLSVTIAVNAQSINNEVVRNAEIAKLDGKYNGTDASVIISLFPNSGGGASITVDFEGQTIQDLIICMWLDSKKNDCPLYLYNKICMFESTHGFFIQYENGKILFTFATDDYRGEIDISHVAFKTNKDSTNIYSDNDLRKSFDYLKVFFKRAE